MDAKAAAKSGLSARFVSGELFTLRDLFRPVYHLLRRWGRRRDSGEPAPTASPSAESSRVRTRKGWDYLCFAAYVVRQVRLFLKHVWLPKPDCIIAFNATELWEARWLAAVHGVPYIYIVWEVWPNQHRYYSARRSRTMALIESIGINRAARVVVDEPAWRRFMELRYRIPRNRFAMVSACSPTIEAPPRPPPGTPMKFYYHGLFVPGRGVAELVRAMKNVMGAWLYLRGFGEYEAELRRIVKQEQLESTVEFLPRLEVTELARSGLEYDVAIICSVPDGVQGRMVIGFKLFQYLASGLAIVAPKTRPLRRFLLDHPVGAIYGQTTPEEIGRAIQHCVDHPELVAQWKREAKSLAEREYNSVAQGQRLVDMVETCRR
jgi:glycosyltransferase involved in cell wall biosynthesis